MCIIGVCSTDKPTSEVRSTLGFLLRSRTDDWPKIRLAEQFECSRKSNDLTAEDLHVAVVCT